MGVGRQVFVAAMLVGGPALAQSPGGPSGDEAAKALSAMLNEAIGRELGLRVLAQRAEAKAAACPAVEPPKQEQK